MYSVLLLLAYIPFFSSAWIHCSMLPSNCPLLSLKITAWPYLIDLICLSVLTIANKDWLRVKSWYNPTRALNPSVTPTALSPSPNHVLHHCSWHPIVAFFRSTKRPCMYFLPSLDFSMNTLKANITAVVLFSTVNSLCPLSNVFLKKSSFHNSFPFLLLYG